MNNGRNPKFFNNISIPDTDSRGIELEGTNIIPNLMFDHSRMQYISPVNNSVTVLIGNFINGEERSLHTLMLNNAANGVAKSFTFSNAYVFLDDTIVNQTKIVNAGKTLFYFGVIILGKMYLLTSIESTN